MRIAISGAHFSGKSTIADELLNHFPNLILIHEPYILLEEMGYDFSDPPTSEDYERQFNFSISSILESSDDALFDRCPVDFLAYALALGAEDIESWDEKMESAIQMLDLIVYLPIEDRMPIPSTEDLELRQQVDEIIHDFLVNDSLELLKDVEVLEVRGSLEKRMRILVAKLNELGMA